MATDNTQFIDNLVQIIMTSEAAESVTNEQVARVFAFLCSRSKELQQAIDDTPSVVNEIINNISNEIAIIKSSTNKGIQDAATAQTGVDAINEKIGHPDGLATLDSEGKVTAEQLPDIPEQRVLPFDGVLVLVSPQIVQGSASGPGEVMYVPSTKTFVYRAGSGLTTKLYSNWPGADEYGPALSTSGRTPHAAKIYVSTSKEVYLWDGEDLSSVTAPLVSALGGLSLRVITPEEDAEMTAAGAHDPDTLYFIPEEE